MKNIGNVFTIACKRIWKRPFMILIFLLFPLSVCFVPGFNRSAEDVHFVAGYLYESEEMEFKKQFETELSSVEDGKDCFVEYRKYDSIKEMEDDLLTGKISCGFYLGREFDQALESGDFRESMTLYIPEGMNYAGIVKEDFTSRLYKTYSAIWFSRQMENSITGAEVLQKLEEDRKNGKVFQILYSGETDGQEASGWETIGQKEEVPIAENAYATENDYAAENAYATSETEMFSLRGVLAFLAFLAAMLGAIDLSRDRKNNIAVGATQRKLFLKITVAIPVLWSILFLFLGVLSQGDLYDVQSFLKETGCILLYGGVLWLLAWILGNLCSERVLAGIMPCIVLVGILCTPVIFNLDKQIPVINMISKIYPVTWYMNLTM